MPEGNTEKKKVGFDQSEGSGVEQDPKNNGGSENNGSEGGGNDGDKKKTKETSNPAPAQPAVQQHQVVLPDVNALAEQAEAKLAFEPKFEPVVDGSPYQKLALSDYSMALSQHAQAIDGEMTQLDIEKQRLEAERATLEAQKQKLQEKIDELKNQDELSDDERRELAEYEAQIAGLDGQIQQIDAAMNAIAGIVGKLAANLADTQKAQAHAKELSEQGATAFIKKPDGEIVAMKSAEAMRLIETERKAAELRGKQPEKMSSMAALMSMFNRNSAKAFAADEAFRTGEVARFNDLSIESFNNRNEQIAQERAVMAA